MIFNNGAHDYDVQEAVEKEVLRYMDAEDSLRQLARMVGALMRKLPPEEVADILNADSRSRWTYVGTKGR